MDDEYEFRGVAPFRNCRHVPTHFFLKMPQNAVAEIDRVVIPETENPQEAKSVYPGTPVWHAYADPGRYFTQSPQC